MPIRTVAGVQLALALLLCVCISTSHAFRSLSGRPAFSAQTTELRVCNRPLRFGRFCNTPLLRRNVVLSLSADPTAAELGEFEELIFSLSAEDTDEARRERVASIFARELASTSIGDAPPRFATLFGKALEKVGTELQETAKEKAEQQVQEQGGKEEDMEKRVQTPEEKQLWALIDMMVQSKMLVRKATVADQKK